MATRWVAERCTVPWCAVEGAHGRHYDIFAQCIGSSVTARTEQAVTVQLGVQGHNDPLPALALVLPGGLRQVDVTMGWDEMAEIARTFLAEHERYKQQKWI